jgi:hypothetical protein
MRVPCPRCKCLVVQSKNQDGPNFCPNCYQLFYLPEQQKLPPWILGVLVILMANLQVVNW